MSKEGIFLGYNSLQKSKWFNEDAHILTIAQSGAGKNTSVIMPNLLSSGFKGTKIILDLKGENAAVCSYWKEQENKGKSYRLNPWGIFGMASIGFNPFCTLDAHSNEIYEDCMDFAEAIVNEKTGQSDTGEHFDEMARDFIGSFLLYFTLEKYPEILTPADLCDELTISLSSINNLSELCEKMMTIIHPDEAIKRSLKLSALSMMGLTTTGENGEFRGIRTTISKALKSFRGKVLSNTVNETVENSRELLDNLFQKKTTNDDLYISFPQNRMSMARVWLRLILTSFIKNLIDHPPSKPILFVLDEFPQLGTFNIIKDNAAFLRGYGIRFWFIGQNIGQFKANYGSEGMQTIFENCTIRQFFNVSDETARYVSKKLGQSNTIIKNYETMEYKSTHVRDIMSQTEIEQFRGVINFITGDRPFKTVKIPYYELERAKLRALPNPLFHGLPAFKDAVDKLLDK